MRAVIGCDPGTNGAIVLLREDLTSIVARTETVEGLLAFLTATSTDRMFRNTPCFIEKVQGFPGQGPKTTGALMKNAGYCEFALTLAHFGTAPTTLLPTHWQKDFGVSSFEGDLSERYRLRKTWISDRVNSLSPIKIVKYATDAWALAYTQLHK